MIGCTTALEAKAALIMKGQDCLSQAESAPEQLPPIEMT